jgi:8-oxo-dGTP pyrophosphatase MutT (NUDIX family)
MNIKLSAHRNLAVPKGGHETGETYAEAAVREAWEEGT